MKIIRILAFCFSSLLLGTTSYGQKLKTDESKPVLFYANSQTYDRELGIIILKGNVEFAHEGNILEADYVSYNENTDIVTASGNVRLRRPEGDITFGEYLELTGDMKKGVILQIRTLMDDDSKLAALEGRKCDEREELDQAVYTPCKLCGDKPPTWQLNARRAVKDDKTKDIYFTDAEMRILDVPIFYLPFATQPLERRSGFLIPLLGYSSDFGPNIAIPYYFALSQDKDLTLTPVFFTQQNPLVFGQYRQAFGGGILRADGSITRYEKSSKDKKEEKAQNFKIPDTRGHYFIETKYDLSERWRLRASGGQVSDKTYFRKYNFSGWKNEPNLTSKGILEGFLTQRDYASGEVYYFQGLRDADRQKSISAPLPYIQYNGYSATDPLGGRFNFNSNLLNLTREKGINMQRGISILSWRRPWLIPFGQVVSVFASTRGDLYQVQDFRRHPSKEKRGGGRFFPQTGVDWRWPLVKSFCKQSYIIGPMAQLIGAPKEPVGIKSRHIPNEDSADFSFNDANLFSPDRFPGYDLIDTGSRAVYGGDLLTTGQLFGDVEVFLGQSYSFTRVSRRERFQGLTPHSSDYVGRIEASPYPWLNLNYRFRLDKGSLDNRVSEVGGSIGPEIAKLSGTYTFISRHALVDNHAFMKRHGFKKHLSGDFERRDFNQISLNFSSRITEYWTLLAELKQDLDRGWKKGRLEEGVGILYKDDCFGLGISVKRQHYKDRDLRPATIVLGTLFLKNVGIENYRWSFNMDQGLFGERSPREKP